MTAEPFGFFGFFGLITHLPAAKAAMPAGCLTGASAPGPGRAFAFPFFPADTEPDQRHDALTVAVHRPSWRVMPPIGCVMFRGGPAIRRGVGVWRLATGDAGVLRTTPAQDGATPGRGLSDD